MGQEIEFKFRVDDEQALDAFARAVGFEPGEHAPRRQQNTFFDSTDARLRSRGLALRLRVEGGRGILTIKGKGTPRSRDGALLSRFEAECPVGMPQVEAILAGSLSPLACLEESKDASVREGLESIREALAGDELTSLGGFENERTTLPLVELQVGGHRERLVFELDRTTFPGGRIDCEIEAEISANVEAGPLMEHLRRLLEQAGIRWSAAPSKLARFLSTLGSSSSTDPAP